VITAGKIKYAQLYNVLECNGYVDDRRAALLFILDFEVFRQTGRAVTTAPYVAADPRPVISRSWRDGIPTARYRFSFGAFTRRELRVLGRLIDTFRWTPAYDLPQPNDVIRDPWAQICLVSIPVGDLVPYTLVLDDRPDSVSIDCAETRAEEAALAAAFFQQKASDAAL
jgi:hypothetical protein